jgi:hypothetical protein
VLATLGDDPDEDGDAGVGATRAALAAPVGSFRVIDGDDVRRLLVAFRLADHVPDEAGLAEAGFLTPGIPALDAGASPETAPVPVPAGRGAESSPGTPGRGSLPRTGRLPASAPESSGPPPGGAIGGLVGVPGRGASRGRYGGRLPDWIWGWRGLTLAAIAAFLVALGLAFLVGRAATGGAPPTEASVVRVVDGITFTRQLRGPRLPPGRGVPA